MDEGRRDLFLGIYSFDLSNGVEAGAGYADHSTAMNKP